MKIMAFDVGGTAIKFGLVDENFEVLFSEEIPTNTYKDTDNMVLRAMEAKLKEYEGQYDAIGISTAGQVNFETSEINDGVGNIPNYNHTNLRNAFEPQFNVPVAVDNDVNCAAIGEAHFGAARGESDFLCLTYGTGVGGCIYINGDVYFSPKQIFEFCNIKSRYSRYKYMRNVGWKFRLEGLHQFFIQHIAFGDCKNTLLINEFRIIFF